MAASCCTLQRASSAAVVQGQGCRQVRFTASIHAARLPSPTFRRPPLWAFVARHTDALTWAWVVLSSLAVAAVSIATFAVLLLTSAASTALANDVVKTLAMVAAVASYGGPIRVELVLSAAAIGGGGARRWKRAREVFSQWASVVYYGFVRPLAAYHLRYVVKEREKNA